MDPSAEYPSYLRLGANGELKRRVNALLALLASCTVCPRNCRVKRLIDRRAVCATGRYAEIVAWGIQTSAAHGIDPGIKSGTVLFGHSNLSGIPIQERHDLSGPWDAGRGIKTARELAEIYLRLQSQGAVQLQWVAPSHVVPQAVEALAIAAQKGLRLPVIYSSQAYDSIETLMLLDGIVDVYLPEVMLMGAKGASGLARALGYESNAIAALREMWRQVGPFREDAGARIFRGLRVRRFFGPGDECETEECLSLLKSDLGNELAGIIEPMQ